MATAQKGRVLVTGATGFLASHLIAQLLEKGYPVRGTVRNVKKAGHLQKWIDEGKDLQLVEADLVSDEGWDEAVKDIVCVMHVASPVDLACRKRHAEERMVRPAVEGTMHVMRAAAAAGVKRVVLTSSLAAVATPKAMAALIREGKPVTAEMHTDPSEPVPYFRSKARGEKAAWEFLQTEEGKNLELAVVCPSVVIGAALSDNFHEALKVVVDHLTGQVPLCPDVAMPMIHVLDVAEAHIRAMEVPEAAGQRFLLAETVTDILEIAHRLKPMFNPLGYKVHTRPCPKWFIPIACRLDKKLKRTRELVGVRPTFDVENSRRVLGVPRRDCWDAMYEMTIDAIERGHIKETKAFGPWVEQRRAGQAAAAGGGGPSVPVTQEIVVAEQSLVITDEHAVQQEASSL